MVDLSPNRNKRSASAGKIRRLEGTRSKKGNGLMKLIGITIAYAAILVGSWELQKYDLLLGYTLGVFGILILTIFTVDYMARKYL